MKGTNPRCGNIGKDAFELQHSNERVLINRNIIIPHDKISHQDRREDGKRDRHYENSADRGD